jgi:hypothetical protein
MSGEWRVVSGEGREWLFEVHKLERVPVEIKVAIDGTFTSKHHGL